MISEAELVERLAPMVEERVRYKVVRSIIDTLEEQCYPPEEMFREEFIKRAEAAEKNAMAGEVNTILMTNSKRNFYMEGGDETAIRHGSRRQTKKRHRAVVKKR